MAVDFCDYFWGEEHNGWNVLYQNMKQGHNASKELTEFFKERWSIDEAYCKSLTKLANKAGSNNEKGTLTPIFALLKASLDMMSSVHLHMVTKIQDLVKEISKYNDELHKKHKSVKDEESQTEEVVKTIQATSNLVQKARENYSQKCQELEKVRRDGASPKDIEKAEAKLRKAHDDYKALVEKYNTIRDDYEKKMTLSCKKFQAVEESHLSQVLQFIQTYIEVSQHDHKATGQIHGEFMNKYSHFTIDKLLDTFALSKYTGLEKPVMMVFEDTSSLGSAISGQQSPEPADQSKSSAEDASSTGEKITTTGVLSGGRVGGDTKSYGLPSMGGFASGFSGLSGVAKLSTNKKDMKATRGKASLFSLSKVSRSGKDSSISDGVTCGIKDEFTNGVKVQSNSFNGKSSSSGVSPSQHISVISRPSRPITYRRPAEQTKNGRRTTSLLNIFVASSSTQGK